MDKVDYRIGLDIGIASVGWAVLENNTFDEPIRIIDMGVRIFDKAEQPKTGEALAAPRRAARSARRRIRRRHHRLERIKNLFVNEGIIDENRFIERYYCNNLPDVYELRYDALNRKLSNDELAQVLLHIAKHRGFKSTRKAETNSKENGQVLSATKENKKIMEDKGYRTVGEMIYLDDSFRTECMWSDKGYILTPRNKAEDYNHTILRDMLEDEVHVIFEKQREFGNNVASEELEQEYLKIMLSQRSFDKGPGGNSPYAMEGFGDRVGKCTFEKEEMRAPKASYTAEYFVALEKINHTRIINKDGDVRNLSDEERKLILNLVFTQKEVKYSAARKACGLDDGDRFNNLNYSSKKKGDSHENSIKETEKAVLVKMPYYHIFTDCIKDKTVGLSEMEKQELFDQIGYILSVYKNDDSRKERLEKLCLSDEEIDKLLDYSPAKFQNLSLKAMQKIIPYLEEGMTYDKACSKAYGDFRADSDTKKSVLLKGTEVTDIINDITNPVVKRSVSQTVKVINAIIMKYGSPQAINIELAREMSKNFDERRKMTKDMEERQKNNEAVKNKIKELGKLNPTGLDIIKYRLWEEQDGICMYSGKKIPLDKLFKEGYDVDHILPYSITFDDSYRNKILVTSEENRQKGNRTPYEYFGQDEKRWSEYEVRVTNFIRDYKKQQRLLKKHFTEEERKEFKERNLNDTKYITRVVYNLIRENLYLAPLFDAKKKKQVRAVNGNITSYLSKIWGLSKKDRRTDLHHSRDAVVIACCTDGMINKISRYVQGRENAYSGNFGFVDENTGEIYERNNFTREQWDEMFGVRFERPWPHFVDEIDIRMGNYLNMGDVQSIYDGPKEYMDAHPDMKRMLNYPEKLYNSLHPIFVSRMPNHKVSGSAHDATIRSPRHYSDGGNVFENGGYVITKTALVNLKLNKDGEIEGYYNQDSDRLLYEALKLQLLKYNNDGKKAFAEPFYKPKADGTPGHVVKTVKISKKLTSGVLVNNGQGIAENGSMVRIDVFNVNGKYFFVPIYTADVVKKVLPNRAATQAKPMEEWRIVEDKDFIFSLYPRDLIHVVNKKGTKITNIDNEQSRMEDMCVYFTGADISTASISGSAHDSSFSFRGLGIQSLEKIEKCQVDILGNISIVKSEKRMSFN